MKQSVQVESDVNSHVHNTLYPYNVWQHWPMMPMEIINTCKPWCKTSSSGKIALKYPIYYWDFFLSIQRYQLSHMQLSTFIFLILFLSFFSNLISDVYQPLSQIRMSLAGSLGAAQVIFLGGINFTENTVRNFAWLVQSLWGRRRGTQI